MALRCDQCQYENKDDALLCNLCGKIFRKAMKSAPTADYIDRVESRMWNDRSVPLIAAGRLDEALDCCKKSLARNPFNASAWVNQAGVLFRTGDVVGALSCFEKAISFEPHLVEAWHGKAVVEYENEDSPSALRSIQELQSISPGSPPASMKAELESKRVVASEREALGWLAEAVARGAQGQFPRALACLEKAIELEPALATAWHLKAGALDKLGKGEEALQSQEKAVELEPGNPRHWHWKGVHLKKLRRFEEAVAAYDRAIALESNQPGYWSDRGLALGCLGPSSEAIECYEKAIALAPEAPAPWYNKALEEDRLGRLPTALESFRRFLQLATPAMLPQIEQAKLRLAELEPPKTTDVQNEARRLFDEKRFEDAVVCLDEALTLDPESAALWTLRGDCLRALGFHEDSAACYDRALESSSNSS